MLGDDNAIMVIFLHDAVAKSSEIDCVIELIILYEVALLQKAFTDDYFCSMMLWQS